MIDIAQIIYALERQARALEEQADRLGQQHDYSAEFPAADAERMREAVLLIRSVPLEPVATIIGSRNTEGHVDWEVSINDAVWALAKKDTTYPWYYRLPVFAA